MMASINHKARATLLMVQALLEKGIVRFNQRTGVLVGFVARLFGGVRSRRALFQNVRKRNVRVRSSQNNGLIDVKRRAFLKYAVFGGVVFFVGKYFGPLMNTLRGDTVLSEKTFDNFKMVETGKQLQISDDDGNEILTIEKEGF